MIVCRGLGVNVESATPLVTSGLGINSLMTEVEIPLPTPGATGGSLGGYAMPAVYWKDSTRFFKGREDDDVVCIVAALLEVIQ